jgi:hypothetical protein
MFYQKLDSNFEEKKSWRLHLHTEFGTRLCLTYWCWLPITPVTSWRYRARREYERSLNIYSPRYQTPLLVCQVDVYPLVIGLRFTTVLLLIDITCTWQVHVHSTTIC